MATRKKNIGIRISSEPDLPNDKKTPVLPFHILFAADLAPAHSDRAQVIRAVDRNGFSAFMQSLAPKLMIDVPDRITGGKAPIECNLNFPDLRAFRPEGIVAQVPLLEKLVLVRNLVNEVRTGQLPSSGFQQKAEAAGIDPGLAARFQRIIVQSSGREKNAAPSAPAQATPRGSRTSAKLGSLLDMVDMGGGEKQPPPPNPLDALYSAISDSATAGGDRVEKSAIEMLLDEIDRMFHSQLCEILHEESFRRCEAAWLGLKFLLDRIDFRANILLSALPVHKEDLLDALERLLVNPALEGHPAAVPGAPVSMVVTDFLFENTADGMDRLELLLDAMASVQVPIVSGVSPAFFGLSSASGLSEVQVLRQHFQQPEYLRWNSLRDRGSSAYGTFVLPGILLRFAYGPDNAVKGFPFDESGTVQTPGTDAPPASMPLLFGSGALALTAALADRFAHSGWPTHIEGRVSGAQIENLPVWENQEGGTRLRMPLEVMIPEAKQEEYCEAGFALLACRPNEDSAYVACAPTIHRPEEYEETEANEEARMHATLTCQLMAARIAHHVEEFTRGAGRWSSAESLQLALIRRLQSLFDPKRAPDAVTVDVSEDPGRPASYQVSVRVFPPAEILGRETTLGISCEISRG